MKPTKITMILLATFLTMQPSFASTDQNATSQLKNQILLLAKSYEGQGDADLSKQRNIEIIVQKLIQENPMPPVIDRIPLLVGTWKQVWGPYDYRKNDGSVDPNLEVKEIYQVIFKDGFYYNVAPFYKNGDKSREQIGILRGEYKLDPDDASSLQVKFTAYPGVEPRPSGINIWELASLAEAGQLENEITIVPSWIVKLFFGGGKLEEIYTDHDLRILYGSNRKKDARRSIIVMSRVN